MKTSKIKTFFSTHKRGVRITAVVVVLALVAGAAGYYYSGAKKSKQSDDSLAYARTVKLERGVLSNVVSAKGTVQSGSVSSVAPTLESKIVKVNVKVGDKVKKGTVIAVQDTGDIDKEIAARRAAMAEEQHELNASHQKPVAQIGNARADRDRSAKEQDAYVNAAAAAKSRAKGESDAAQATFASAQSAYKSAVASVSSAQSKYDAAQTDLQRAYEAWIAAGSPAADANPQKIAYKSAESAASEKKNGLEQAKAIYSLDHVAAAYEAAKTDKEGKAAALETAESAYTSAVHTRQNVLSEQDRAIGDLTDQLNAAGRTKGKGVASTELNDLLKRKENAVLRAETDGEVTELKAVVGSLPKDTIATIQSTGQLTLAIHIAEHDINTVKIGLPAIITSESTSAQIKGVLSRISPTAEKPEGGGTGFSADITIKDGGGLRIGSKGRAEIIISSKENVLLAPIDAVGTNAQGEAWLMKMEKGVPKKIKVTTGDKNDYLIEVSGDGISEGMEVLANANWGGLVKTAKDKVKADEDMMVH
ncbi:MAG: HlyD family efflux transporter periplasmic adaptor subunit [Clostridiales Family XIII bacterium]|jgi:multidrug efflux pump subunit AcrA (membrane-fusion protein)|nr:HlyD family efflux transporter periplasmic adaptor subunit [Clostridiales Family XIII bacterium]